MIEYIYQKLLIASQKVYFKAILSFHIYARVSVIRKFYRM